jgi:hypothetical protein
VDDVALEEVFFRVLRSSRVILIPPMLRTTFHLHFAVTRSLKPGDLPKIADSEMWGHRREKSCFPPFKGLIVALSKQA